MTTLVLGATGATGRLLVDQLLQRGEHVKAIVRSPEKLSPSVRADDRLTLVQASILALSDAEISRHVSGCGAVASCLGHNLTLKGIYGPPRLLVTEATRRCCRAMIAQNAAGPLKFVLMNTAGNRNPDRHEPLSLAERAVTGLLRLVLPPQRDNEQAAEYLRATIGQNHARITWVAVRPDSLIDEQQVTPYVVVPSPTRSALFNAGQTSRLNVAHFMAELITNDYTWQQWQGQMPVIYNQE